MQLIRVGKWHLHPSAGHQDWQVAPLPIGMERRSAGLAGGAFTHWITPPALVWILIVPESLMCWRLGLQLMNSVGLFRGEA